LVRPRQAQKYIQINPKPFHKVTVKFLKILILPTYKYKEKFVILQLIGIIDIKVKKHGGWPTPADILVGI